MKWLLVAISCYLLLIVLPSVIEREQQTEQQRLRVIANSNSDYDQQQKQLIADDAIQLLANKTINRNAIEKTLKSKYPHEHIRVTNHSHLFPAKYEQGIFTAQNYYPSLVL